MRCLPRLIMLLAMLLTPSWTVAQPPRQPGRRGPAGPGGFRTPSVLVHIPSTAKAWYSPRLLREAERRKLFGPTQPVHVPTLAESTAYWQLRDAAGSIPAAVANCPRVAVIVYANQRDHVQVAPDHPHILSQVEGFRKAGARFVRLNPDRSYVEAIVSADQRRSDRKFPDNDAGVAWNRANIGSGLEPDDLPMQPYMQAAVAELADRVQAGSWAKNLDTVLYPAAPRPGQFRPRQRERFPQVQAAGSPR